MGILSGFATLLFVPPVELRTGVTADEPGGENPADFTSWERIDGVGGSQEMRLGKVRE